MKDGNGDDSAQKHDASPTVNATPSQSVVSVMAAMVQDLMDASNDRFGKLVETLCANKPWSCAEGAGMKA